MSAKFGPAGTSDSFKAMGYKYSLQVPEYVVKMGLDCFEYQCGRGVNIGLDKAKLLGQAAKEKGITLSLHAPYYISMSSVEEEKRLNSVNYILASALRLMLWAVTELLFIQALAVKFHAVKRWSSQRIQCVCL